MNMRVDTYPCLYDNVCLARTYSIPLQQQFFISSLPSNDVLNGIAEALRLRIARAYREKKQFRVVVVMPLLPGLAGEIGKASGTILEAVMHWTYTSISRGKESLISRLINIDGSAFCL